MKLHPVNYNHSGKPWCGIIALSAVTGNPTEHSRQVFKEVLNDKRTLTGTKRILKGIYDSEFLECLKRFCIDAKRVPIAFPPIPECSFSRFLHWYKLPEGKVGIATIPHHIIAFNNERIVDSQNLTGIPIPFFSRLDEPVQRVWELSQDTLENL